MKLINTPGINGLNMTHGCEKAYEKILSYLEKIHTNENGKVIDINSLDKLKIDLDNSNIEENINSIYKKSKEILNNEYEKTIFIGGDHSVSYPLGKAFLEHCNASNKKPCMIIFDSHPDCMEPMQEPTHEEWLRALVEEGFPAENVLIIGLRNSWKGELDYMKEKGIRHIPINSIIEDIDNIADTIMEFGFGKEVYVSLDIDVVDPAFAPATGYPVSGGLTSRQMIYLMQRINKIKGLKAIDIVEINPSKDINDMTSRLGAKIIAELV